MNSFIQHSIRSGLLYIFLVLLAISGAWSCKEIFDPPPSKLTNEALLDYMKELVFMV